jgi:hypothetical protein
MLAGVVLAATVCAGCSPPSLLFTRIVEPYSANFTDTTVGNKICRVTDHQVRVPVSGQSITALWSMDHIRRALDDAGITRISYVDRETLSFLRGIYRRRELIIYGE